MSKNNDDDIVTFELSARMYPVLTDEEIEKLYTNIRMGGQAKEEALKTLISSHQVMKIIEKKSSCFGEPNKDDLFQYGLITLLENSSNYDPDRGPFTTYASLIMEAKAIPSFGKTLETISINNNYLKDTNKIKKCIAAYKKNFGEEPSENELFEYIKDSLKYKISRKKLREILEFINIQKKIRSIDETIGKDDKSYSLGDTIEDINAEESYHKVEAKLSALDLETVLENCHLSDIGYNVLRLSLGINTYCHTLDEIAEELGITKERCRQVHASSMRKIIKTAKSNPDGSMLL